MKAFTITSILAAACVLAAASPAAESQARTAAAAQAAAGIPKQDPQLIKGQLPNGLTYFIRPNAEPKGRFSIRLRVNTGSLNETDDIQGISHFLEHMVFNGSKHFKRGEMIPAMQKEGLGLGGDANAYTSFDETVYTMDVPSMKESTVNLAFTIMRDFADGALLEESAINAERGIITSEYKARDSAGYRVMKEVFSIMLDGTKIPHRYPIGTLEVIQNAPREKFVNYYQTHYVPSQMQLVIAGDITPEQGKEWVEKYFGSMKKDDYSFKADRGTLKTATEATSHWITNKEATSTEISINIVRPYEKKPDTIANRTKDIPLNMAYAMLNRRLEKMAKNTECPFISADAGRMELLETAEVDAIQARADYKNWKTVLTTMEQELRRAVEFGFNKEELAEARSNSISAAENAIKSWPTAKSESLASAIAQSAAQDMVFTTPEEDWSISREVIETLTPEQCRAALEKAWSNAHPRVIVTSNKENAQGSSEAMKAYREAQAAKVEPYRVDEQKAFSYKFGEPGKVTAKKDAADLGVTQLTLSNGVRVNLKPTEFDKDSINITFAVDGGGLSRPEKAAGLEIFTGAVMNGGGLTNHSNDDLAAVMAGKKVGVGFSMTDRSFVLAGNTNRKDLETQLQLQTAYLMYPGYREDGVVQLRRAIPMLYNKLAHEAQGAMKTQVPAILYKNNPRFTFPEQKQLESYQIKEVRDWVDAPLKNNYMEVTVTGDFKPEDIIPMLERTVGALPKRADAPAALDEKLRHPAMADFNFSRDLEYDSSIDKTLVCLFWKTPGGEDKKLARRLNMLKAVFYDRVFKGIREDMGETYSPFTGINISETYPDDGYIFTISSGVMRNKDAVRNAIAKIATELGKGNVTQEELDRARNPILNSMERAQRDNGYWMGLLKDSQARPDRLTQQRESIPDVKA
ncbi:insulinase family protein, partial [Bacteroides caccae]|uniref:M16 family metallopeptidase n=1 Tax=Bacteroides caccae TaxID=47678 RepID=UPI001231166C